MSQLRIEFMQRQDWPEVAALIRDSTNAWYESAGKRPIFTCTAEEMLLFCQVYEDLDPGCCVIAKAPSGQIAGSCFFHPRSTHISLGIMNVHPTFFSQGVASALLKYVTDLADQEGKSTRLLSSAMNLDSFSLYSRAGFAPVQIFQDMVLPVPATGLAISLPAGFRLRDASPADASAMARLEFELAHIQREADYRYFLNDHDGIWHASVVETDAGEMEGFLVSVNHPASRMLGPGIACTQNGALALIMAELNHHRGHAPVFLIPVQARDLVQALYARGARNCEIHLAQVRGKFTPSDAIVMPTFMPETG